MPSDLKEMCLGLVASFCGGDVMCCFFLPLPSPLSPPTPLSPSPLSPPLSPLPSPLPPDVPMWLKSLRLHKYQPLFADLSYQEMLDIREEYLESKVRRKEWG